MTPQRSVLVVAPKLFVSGRAGGGERYATEFIHALRRRHQYRLQIVTGEGYGKMVERDPTTLEPVGGVSRKKFCAMMDEVDVVHLFQLDSHLADVVLMHRVRSSTPVVTSDLGGGWPTVGRAVGRLRYPLIAGCAAISHAGIEDLRWPEDRPSTILYGGGDHLRPSGEDRPKIFDFVFVGRLVEHKGVHLLLEALPDGATCLIAGAPLNAAYLEELRDRAPNERVTFWVGPTDDEVVAAYESARWSVSPTLAHVNGRRLRRPELLGLSPIESIALGTPAVLSDIPAYAELANLVGMPTFAADSVSSLRSVLGAVKDMQPDMGFAMAELSWDRVAEKAGAFYAQIYC